MTSRRRFVSGTAATAGVGVATMLLPSAARAASGASLPPDPTGFGGGATSGISITDLTLALEEDYGWGRRYGLGFTIQNNMVPETWASGVVVKIYALIEGAWVDVYTTTEQNFYLGGSFGTGFVIVDPTPDPPGFWRGVIVDSDVPVVVDTANFSGVR